MFGRTSGYFIQLRNPSEPKRRRHSRVFVDKSDDAIAHLEEPLLKHGVLRVCNSLLSGEKLPRPSKP